MKRPLELIKKTTSKYIWRQNHLPDEILILPARTDTSNLEYKHTVIFQKIVHLCQKLRIAADTNVLQKVFNINTCR